VKLSRAIITVAVAAVVPLLPAAAYADRYTHADPAGDVASTVGQSDTYTPAPERVEGDVISSTVKHGARTVVMTLVYRDLSDSAEVDGHVYFVHTSKMNRVVRLYANSTNPGGKAVLTKANGKKVSCHVRRHIDYNLNTAKVIVPRSCLGQPRWVKVGMGSVMFSAAGASGPVWIDDALSTGTNGRAVYGPKVFR
jgi:hypothetical protein